MKSVTKILGVIIVILLLLSSIFAVFFTGDQNDDEIVVIDIIPPTIDSITGNTTGTTGKITTIMVTFSDDVTTATLYYRSANVDKWSDTSVLSGSADILIPSSSDKDWYYYVTADDAKGNGPVGNPSIDGSKYYRIIVTEAKKDLVHHVFVEEATATWCSNCPDIANILNEVYNEENPSFLYVSLVEDENIKAHDRLYDEYNVYGFPSVFFDGGYATCCIDVMVEERTPALFKKKINEVASRELPDVFLNLEAEWDDNTSELTTTVTVENEESDEYTGRLKVYLTEIVSRWADWNGNPYHYGFLDYSIDKDVTIDKNSNKTYTSTWDADDSNYGNIYPENLWIIAVLFKSDSEIKYSDPPRNKNQFNAHFAIAATATKVSKGKLPPSIGISAPREFTHYILGNENKNKLLRFTYIIGKLDLTVNIEAESGVEKVEYLIKGPLREIKETITSSPYSYTWKKFAFGKYTITVKVYDKEGRTSTDSIEVLAFML